MRAKVNRLLVHGRASGQFVEGDASLRHGPEIRVFLAEAVFQKDSLVVQDLALNVRKSERRGLSQTRITRARGANLVLYAVILRLKLIELGLQISNDMTGRQLTLVSVLKGSLPFMADLMRAISLPLRIDLMEVSSYGGATTESSGLVRILKDLSSSIEGEDVLIVEDIIDTGLTLNYLVKYLRGKKPASLRICTLLDKPARRLVEIDVDYTGFTIPDQFVVGYGLDYGELYRNLRFVGVLKPEVYSQG